MANNNSFCREMRKATRDVHKISDALVNAKLAFALSDDGVWSDGLLIFYEIFKYLEEHVDFPTEFHRKDAFEKDLIYYLGSDWKQNYEPRQKVKKYLKHLENIRNSNPILLWAYVYHLYMGLLSGGQILQKKRSIVKMLNPLQTPDGNIPNGNNVTHFDDYTIAELKEKMRTLVDEKCEKCSEEIRQLLLQESRKVFELNNTIIRTVHGVNRANIRTCMYIILVVIFIFFIGSKLNLQK